LRCEQIVKPNSTGQPTDITRRYVPCSTSSPVAATIGGAWASQQRGETSRSPQLAVLPSMSGTHA
jgi:hypothetical protein